MHILVWIADGGIAVGQVAKTKKKKKGTCALRQSVQG